MGPAGEDDDVAREAAAVAAGHPAAAREQLDGADLGLLERGARGVACSIRCAARLAPVIPSERRVIVDAVGVLERAAEQVALEHTTARWPARARCAAAEPGWATADDHNVVIEAIRA